MLTVIQKGTAVHAAMWTQCECHTGLIVSCFPAVGQIFRHYVISSSSSLSDGGTSTRILRRVPEIYSTDPTLIEWELESGSVAGDGGLTEVVVESDKNEGLGVVEADIVIHEPARAELPKKLDSSRLMPSWE